MGKRAVDPQAEGDFVIIIESNNGSKWPRFLSDEIEGGESERPIRFATAEAAREAARGRMWENALVWWVVELATEGRVQYGTDVGR